MIKKRCKFERRIRLETCCIPSPTCPQAQPQAQAPTHPQTDTAVATQQHAHPLVATAAQHNPEDECVVCLSAPRQTCCIPCGHVCMVRHLVGQWSLLLGYGPGRGGGRRIQALAETGTCCILGLFKKDAQAFAASVHTAVYCRGYCS